MCIKAVSITLTVLMLVHSNNMWHDLCHAFVREPFQLISRQRWVMTVKKFHEWVISYNGAHKSGGHIIRKGANDDEATGERHKHPEQSAELAQSSAPASLTIGLGRTNTKGKGGKQLCLLYNFNSGHKTGESGSK